MDVIEKLTGVIGAIIFDSGTGMNIEDITCLTRLSSSCVAPASADMSGIPSACSLSFSSSVVSGAVSAIEVRCSAIL